MIPTLLVPGTLCDERLFLKLAAGLGPGARALPPIAHAEVGAAAGALLANAPARFVAVGFSLGGFIVLELLRRAPERLAGAVLIASNAHPLARGQADARRAEVAAARAQGCAAVADALWPRYVAEGRLADGDMRSLIRAMADAVGPERFARQAELAITRPDSWPTVRDARVPVLALCGDEDRMCPPDRCALTESSTARTVRLPGVGHFIPLEAPEAAVRMIAAWAAELEPCC